ncbi:hypothetical protein NLG97_g8333 [Lecanicillium saksenae]|uniref:Uncharacterized protein n=1 Tax=Lecanicillium saksenae TaxID=468837 RepID=A0ACC1QJ80_9HYPO|nr:hypothetical protein NLG97_g8333 [Lecanicillium saksenae]
MVNFYAGAVVLCTLMASAAAKVVTIEVGHNGNPYFKPDYAKADVGDTIEFVFDSKEHSVPSVFRVPVNNTDPIMVYSSVGLECQTGMVAVVNANALQTLTTYRDKAKMSFKNTSPDRIFGGVLSKDASGKDPKRGSAGRITTSVVGTSLMALGLAAALA